MECPPTVNRVLFPMFAQTKKYFPEKGAGATAPEGLFCLDFLLCKREGRPLPYGDRRYISKQKRHADIPAMHSFILLLAAGAQEGAFFKKPPLDSPKNFSATDTGMLGACAQGNVSADQPRRKAALGCWVRAPKATYQPISPAARRHWDVGRAHPKLTIGLSAPPQGGAGRGIQSRTRRRGALQSGRSCR